MNWDKYLENSEKTLSKEFFLERQSEQMLLHGTVGVLTEIEELLDNFTGKTNDLNIKEEISDITWYVAIFGRKFDLNLPDINLKSNNPKIVIEDINKNALKMLDIFKKKMFYNREIDYEILRDLSTTLFVCVKILANSYNLDINNIFELNIQKLRKRYGDKFSSEKANNRNINAEEEIMKKVEEKAPEPTNNEDGINIENIEIDEDEIKKYVEDEKSEE